MAAYHGGNGGDKAATESNMSLEEDGKKNKKIAYRARKTHKLRECQMKKNEKAEQKVAKSAECRYRYKDRIRSVAGRTAPNGLCSAAAAPCGVQFVNVVCCMPRLAKKLPFCIQNERVS